MREVQDNQQYQPCHTTVAVSLNQTGHDTENLGPDDARREHNAKYIVNSKTSTASEPLSLPTTSAARKRGGTRRPPLPPLLPLPFWKRGNVIQESLRPPVRLRSPLLFLLLLLLLLPLPRPELELQEPADSGVVDAIATSEQRHREERRASVRAPRRRGQPLRLGNLLKRLRPHPRRQGLRSPWGVVRLAPCLLTGPGGCLLAP